MSILLLSSGSADSDGGPGAASVEPTVVGGGLACFGCVVIFLPSYHGGVAIQKGI